MFNSRLYKLLGALIIFLSLSTISYAQSVESITFLGGAGDDDASSGGYAEPVRGGGYIVTGWAWNSFADYSPDVYVARISKDSKSEWGMVYGGDGYDYGYHVIEATDGGFIVVGASNSFGSGDWDLYVIRIDSSGDTLWTRTIGSTGDEQGRMVKNADDGGFIIVGTTSSYGNGENDVYLVKLDSVGDTVWTRTFGGTLDDSAYAISRVTEGGYIIAGYTHSFGAGGGDAYLIRTDDNGDTIWTRTFGGDSFDVARSVVETDEGNFLVVGTTSSFSAYSDGYVLLVDRDGNLIDSLIMWEDSSSESFVSMYKAIDGGFIIGGSFNNNPYIVKLNKNLDTVFTMVLDTIAYEASLSSVCQGDDLWYVVSGSALTMPDHHFYNIFLLKSTYESVEEDKPYYHKYGIEGLSVGKNAIWVKFSTASGQDVVFTLYDLMGRAIKRLHIADGDITHKVLIPVEALHNGLYILEMKTKDMRDIRKVVLVR